MISRIPSRCLACSSAVTLRVQVGHELAQPVAIVCPECFTPIRLRLLLDAPPHVGVEFQENCEASDEEGQVVNVGVGFMISRARLHDELYFPVMDLPKPDEAVLQAMGDARPEGSKGPLMLDLVELLGGLPGSKDIWRALRTAYGFSRTEQDDRMRALLRKYAPDDIQDADLKIEPALAGFFVRFLSPYGDIALRRLTAECARIRLVNEGEFLRLREDFRRKRLDRMDQYVDLFDHFFRAYEEFNQALLYVRKGLPLPDDAYAPSTDFESTRMYYGEAFEVLGSHIDLLAALNNIALGRPFDQLGLISLQAYRTTDKGRRTDTLAANPELHWVVAEYDNSLRNASHHRWLRLSRDRSHLSYQEGGRGDLKTLSYADYLRQCCAITSQLMVLAALELALLTD